MKKYFTPTSAVPKRKDKRSSNFLMTVTHQLSIGSLVILKKQLLLYINLGTRTGVDIPEKFFLKSDHVMYREYLSLYSIKRKCQDAAQICKRTAAVDFPTCVQMMFACINTFIYFHKMHWHYIYCQAPQSADHQDLLMSSRVLAHYWGLCNVFLIRQGNWLEAHHRC